MQTEKKITSVFKDLKIKLRRHDEDLMVTSDKMPCATHDHGVVVQIAGTRGVQGRAPTLRARQFQEGLSKHALAYGTTWVMLWK